MNLLVLGGTGAMGAPLVELLQLQGHALTVTSRSRGDVTPQVRYCQGDAHDPRFLNPLLASTAWDAIVDFLVYSTPVFRARMPALLAATRQYVYLSSARVYAPSPTPLTETAPRLLEVCRDQAYLATDEYALAKARQEDCLWAAPTPNWTIVRPYITFSPARLQLGVLEKEAWLFRVLQGRTLVFSADLHERLTTLTQGADVARALVALLGRPEALGEAFHITSPVALRWAEVLDRYLETLEAHGAVRPRVRLVDLPTFQRLHPTPAQLTYDRLHDRTFDNQKIQRFIDPGRFQDPRLALPACLAAFLANRRFLTISGRYEGRKDRLMREHTPVSQFPTLKHQLGYVAARWLFL